jgi:hypothetical protein
VSTLAVDPYTERGTCQYYITARSKYACGATVSSTSSTPSFSPTPSITASSSRSPTPAPAPVAANAPATAAVAGATAGGLVGGAAIAVGSLWFASHVLKMPLTFLVQKPVGFAAAGGSRFYMTIDK